MDLSPSYQYDMSASMARWVTQLFVGVVSIFFSVSLIRAEVLSRTGPADNPDKWPDWGGTPDVSLPEEIGLSSEELDAYLDRLASADPSTRVRSVEELMRDAAGSETVFREKLFGNHGARNDEMRDAIRAARRNIENDTPQGLLKGLIAIDPSDSRNGNGAGAALRVLAMLHALASLDTLAAYKVMIDFSPRHAGGFRHEIGKLIIKNGMNAMPALVYGRGSKDKNIHMFSVKWIRDMGNPLLSEQVRIKNPRRLAQLLESYASVNELDAVDITLSLSNHTSAFVRAAARSALSVYGRNAFWPARRKYENTFGDEPSKAMDVIAILNALYQHFDSQRLAKSRALFATGLNAHEQGELEEMARIYKSVLKTEPMFPRRAEMAAGFLDLADAIEGDTSADRKKAALMLAKRVSPPESSTAKQADAELMWLQAEAYRQAGLAPLALYHRILSLDPKHTGAKEMIDILTPEKDVRRDLCINALQVSFVIFLAFTLIFMRFRTPR